MRLMCVAFIALVPALQVSTLAQSKPDFSGRWTYNQAMSDPGTAGAQGPQSAVGFPTDVVIKQTAGELNLETGTNRQDVIVVSYTLDGSEVTVAGPAGITIKSKAMLEGDKLVVISKRSFSSPIGDVTADIKEVYSLTGNVLTVEKTQTVSGVSRTNKAVYNKASS